MQRLFAGPFARYKILLDAATGNYDEATQLLDDVIRGSDDQNMKNLVMMVRDEAFLHGINPMMLHNLNSYPDFVHRLAEFRVLRGLLLLEQGDNAAAATSFRDALATAGDAGEQMHFNGRVFARRYLELIERA
jgi:hypothetical protein